jgi:hypothetical protein
VAFQHIGKRASRKGLLANYSRTNSNFNLTKEDVGL